MTTARPNVLLLISHDTGRRLGCYGAGVMTPNLDRLAAEGARCTRAFCAAPQCSPSRAALMTGVSPHRTGMLGLAHLGWSIHREVPKLPRLLADAGYETALVGLEHEGAASAAGAHGYRHVVPVPGNDAVEVADRGVELLRAMAGGPAPFFTCLGFFQTHRPFPEVAADGPPAVDVPPWLPDLPGIRHDLAGFDRSVARLDEGVGRVLSALEGLSLSQDTLVIATTDHGIAFPGAKGTLHDPGLETALVLRWPGRIGPGRTIDALISNLDLLPTLCELAGSSTPDGIEGRSLLGSLLGRTGGGRRELFSELTWHDAYHPVRGIRTEDFKYIWHARPGPRVYLPVDIHQSPAGEAVRADCYVPRPAGEELYDLRADPLERRDLAGDPRYAGTLRELRDAVAGWREATRDPLLDGDIPGEASPRWRPEREAGRVPLDWGAP